MAEKTFGITYEGPGLDDGTMPVRELAPSLLALGELFTAASVVKFPTREPVALRIKATDKGSFDVDLIAQTKKVFDEAVDIFASNPVQALETFIFFLVGGSKSLFWLINKIRGREIVEEIPAPEPGHVTLRLIDGTEVAGIPTDVVAFFKELPVRRRAREFVAPLYREDIDRVYFRIDKAVQAQVTDGDLPAYELVPPEEEVVHDLIESRVLDVVSPVFEEGNRWTFFDGERKFNAPIEDEEFLARVEAHEPFSKGDTLFADVHVIQTRDERGKLHIERSVVRVREHRRFVDEHTTLGEDDAPSGT